MAIRHGTEAATDTDHERAAIAELHTVLERQAAFCADPSTLLHERREHLQPLAGALPAAANGSRRRRDRA